MTRLDKHLAITDLSKSREKAKREILAGWVKINGETCRDASRLVQGDEEITVSRPGGDYVSRGGFKLEKAISEFNIDVSGLIAADLGASTGGFTDCLLKNGAQKVYAVDVGYGQLAYTLRTDDRVVVYERQNARYITKDMFQEDITFVSADLSFISFTKVYPVIHEIFPGCRGVALIKPQFEADKSEHKKGIVKEKSIHVSILQRVLGTLVEQSCSILGLTFSPVKGPKGNIEFLLYFSTIVTDSVFTLHDVEAVVEKAYETL